MQCIFYQTKIVFSFFPLIESAIRTHHITPHTVNLSNLTSSSALIGHQIATNKDNMVDHSRFSLLALEAYSSS